MKVWEYILPKKSPIIIWGAGENGRDWFRFLKKIGRNVICFFDKNACDIKYDFEIEVKTPEVCVLDDVILLVSPDKYTEIITDSAKQLGYKNILYGNILKFIPRYEDFDVSFPHFGHFYSLYPDLYDVDDNYDEVLLLSKSTDENDGICMNIEKQCSILKQMNELFDTSPNWGIYGDDTLSKFRYRIGNLSINLSDSLVLHFMLRVLKPNRLIEVGSGYSSTIILDTNEYYLDNRIKVKLVEPYPQLVNSLLKDSDDAQNLIIPSKLQNVPIEFFESLEENDVLFVDSTHVSKFGSDVNYLFFHILPHLNKGVYIHLHDIFYPWQYPFNWIKKGRGWNELFLLRAFLQYNNNFEITFFNHYMATEYAEKYHKEWRKIPDLAGGSFWMKKIK